MVLKETDIQALKVAQRYRDQVTVTIIPSTALSSLFFSLLWIKILRYQSVKFDRLLFTGIFFNWKEKWRNSNFRIAIQYSIKRLISLLLIKGTLEGKRNENKSKICGTSEAVWVAKYLLYKNIFVTKVLLAK